MAPNLFIIGDASTNALYLSGINFLTSKRTSHGKEERKMVWRLYNLYNTCNTTEWNYLIFYIQE